jgi:adenylate cyclase
VRLNLLRGRFRLGPSMLVLFTTLVLPFLAFIVAIDYWNNSLAVNTTSKDMVNRFNHQIVREVEQTIDPVISLARSAATLAAIDPEFFKKDASWDLLKTHIEHSAVITSAYVGFADGSLLMVFRASEKSLFLGKPPPPQTKYIFRQINRLENQILDEQLIFMGADDKIIETRPATESVDPRTRPWYQAAVKEKKSIFYGPLKGASTGQNELTFATPVMVNDKVVAVAALDISTASIEAFLNDQRISTNAISVVLDSQMRVIASSDIKTTGTETVGAVSQVSDLTSDLPRRALLSLPSTQFLGAFQFDSGDGHTNYIASLSKVDLKVSTDWRILSIAPKQDFLIEITNSGRFVLLIGLIALIAQFFVIYAMSVRIARPLEQLARQVDDIEQFKVLEDVPLTHSLFTEIDRLSTSIDCMRKAIGAFSAFVPIDLVRELLKPGKKLELGGRSRFLTIMFCDLESFTSLSESMPSQQLLLHVSKYLQIATHHINEEMGTVDKFTGDGVMAFWGAPNAIEDHAFRACAAAVKIQEQMDEINKEWESKGFPPLKVRIGIHSDVVLVGNIGSLERMSYTVMGDGVNIAARLEGINKERGTRICVSKTVVRDAGERLKLRALDAVTVRGRKSTIEVYELLGLAPTE